MAFYWTTGQLPEFAGVPPEIREEILEAAIFSLRITWRNLGAVFGVMLPVTALGVYLSDLLGGWAFFCWAPLGVFSLNVVFLNLARPRIRELLQAGDSPGE